jgi:hypothetical protein
VFGRLFVICVGILLLGLLYDASEDICDFDTGIRLASDGVADAGGNESFCSCLIGGLPSKAKMIFETLIRMYSLFFSCFPTRKQVNFDFEMNKSKKKNS